MTKKIHYKTIVKTTILVDAEVHRRAKLAMIVHNTSFQKELIKTIEKWSKKVRK